MSRPRLALATRPTPLTHLRRTSTSLGVELWVKRDDLTGSTLTGNKVRKLEYLLADAKAQHADVILTCGGVQSNHCRATAIAARQEGMDSVLFLRVADPSIVPPPSANLLLDRVVGADLRYISRADYARRAELMAEAARALVGRRPYVIPEGGSNAIGSLGYVDCVAEIAAQIDAPDRPLTIVYAAGSGGTGAGLVAGVLSRGLPWRVVGVNVCDDRAYFVNAIGSIVDAMKAREGYTFPFSRDALEIIDGFVGRGYALSSPAELQAIIALARAEGLVLDPVYTGKAWYGLMETLRRDPRALGERIIFLHSGGIYGLLAESEALSSLL